MYKQDLTLITDKGSYAFKLNDPTGSTTLGRPKSNDNEGVLYNPQIFRTGASLSDPV